MKKLKYFLFIVISMMAYSCTEHNITPKGDDDPIGIPPPPPPPPGEGQGG